MGQLPQWLASFWVSTQAPLQLVRPGPQIKSHSLLLQTSFGAQTFAQAPQLLGLEVKSTQTPLQLVSAPQSQAPLRQLWPGPQTLKQLPQLAGSLSGLTHTPLQSIRGAAHWLTHLALMHSSLVPHARLQSLQCIGLVLTSTQLLPHFFRPPEQKPTQAPVWQSCPDAHCFPQAPQLLASVSVLVQTLPHDLAGGRQPHVPLLQLSIPAQTMGQVPQCSLSVWRFTQLPPQSESGAVQVPAQTPVLQTLPVPQAFPQAPQLAGSVLSTTQAAPQRI